MAKINFKTIKLSIEKQAGSRITKTTEQIFDKRYVTAREKLLDDIENDDISVEIKNGPTSDNLSGLLDKGNLYSFFGFESNKDPITNLMIFLDQNISIEPSRLTRGKKYITVSTKVKVPTLEAIENSSAAEITNEYPNSGWIHGVRQGHSGYGKYIYDVVRAFRTSRSGTGLEINGPTAIGSFRSKVEYISSNFEEFKRRLQNG